VSSIKTFPFRCDFIISTDRDSKLARCYSVRMSSRSAQRCPTNDGCYYWKNVHARIGMDAARRRSRDFVMPSPVYLHSARSPPLRWSNKFNNGIFRATGLSFATWKRLSNHEIPEKSGTFPLPVSVPPAGKRKNRSPTSSPRTLRASYPRMKHSHGWFTAIYVAANLSYRTRPYFSIAKPRASSISSRIVASTHRTVDRTDAAIGKIRKLARSRNDHVTIAWSTGASCRSRACHFVSVCVRRRSGLTARPCIARRRDMQKRIVQRRECGGSVARFYL